MGMKKLENDQPFEIQIKNGIVLTVRPMSEFDLAVAHASARAVVDRLEESVSDVYEAGLLPDRNIDVGNTIQREALYHSCVVGELAERCITGWTGVLDQDGNDIDVSLPDARRMAVRLYPVGTTFYNVLTSRFLEIDAVKKDCAVGQSGISSPAAVKDIAIPVNSQEVRVPTESPA